MFMLPHRASRRFFPAVLPAGASRRFARGDGYQKVSESSMRG